VRHDIARVLTILRQRDIEALADVGPGDEA
jgi:ribosomal protein L29